MGKARLLIITMCLAYVAWALAAKVYAFDQSLISVALTSIRI
jgi:cytochrome c-type biogenesis protein CcmE